MHEHLVIDRLLALSECKRLQQIIDERAVRKKRLQTILRLPELALELWEKVEPLLCERGLNRVTRGRRSYNLIGLSDYITLSRHKSPIPIHRDARDRVIYQGRRSRNIVCLYKVAIYLNTLSDSFDKRKHGGTILYDRHRRPVADVSSKAGRALIFDIRDLHSGAPMPLNETKYVLGFRLLYRRDTSDA
jgi:hypothetical protein